jgi:hypothetical protein
MAGRVSFDPESSHDVDAPHRAPRHHAAEGPPLALRGVALDGDDGRALRRLVADGAQRGQGSLHTAGAMSGLRRAPQRGARDAGEPGEGRNAGGGQTGGCGAQQNDGNPNGGGLTVSQQRLYTSPKERYRAAYLRGLERRRSVAVSGELYARIEAAADVAGEPTRATADRLIREALDRAEMLDMGRLDLPGES